MKKVLYILVAFAFSLKMAAQESQSSYTMLRIPASSHAAALGGENISLIDEVPSLGYTNPALYSSAPDKTIGLTFMTYPDAGKVMGAQFVKGFGERHTLGVAAQLLSYGKTDETDPSGNVTGSFNPSDFVLSLGYSYLLSDRWAGGANVKMINSNYGQYSSMALAVDLGLNYYDDEQDLSVSVALNNIGTQIKSFHEDESPSVPYNLQLGMTKGLASLPVRLSVTLTDLTRWSADYYFRADETKKMGFTRKALNHVVIGAEVLPTDIIYIAAGYNFRRAYELKQAGGSHFAGFTCGAGLRLDRFKFGASFAKYSLGASSLMFNLGYRL